MNKILRIPTFDAPATPAPPPQGVPPGSCRDCRFWLKKPDPQDVAAEKGECRHGPPAMFAVPVPGGAQVVAMPPQCAGDFGCFQFRDREAQ